MQYHHNLCNYEYTEIQIWVEYFLFREKLVFINPLNANPTKWSNTLKPFVGFYRRIVSVYLTILWGWHLKSPMLIGILSVTRSMWYRQFNDTHMKELALYWIQYKNPFKYKVGCCWRFSYVYTSNKVLLIPLSCRCLKNVIHQIGSKNEWLLLLLAFTAKLELVF